MSAKQITVLTVVGASVLAVIAIVGNRFLSRQPTMAVNTEWHEEPINKDAVSWHGSYNNALEELKLVSHGWKIHEDEEKKGEVSWGFKARFEFHPKDKQDRSGPEWSKISMIMPISRIDYQLFDDAEFLVGSLTLTSNGEPTQVPINGTNWGMSVSERKPASFQLSGRMPLANARRAKRAKISIQAGYHPQPTVDTSALDVHHATIYPRLQAFAKAHDFTYYESGSIYWDDIRTKLQLGQSLTASDIQHMTAAVLKAKSAARWSNDRSMDSALNDLAEWGLPSKSRRISFEDAMKLPARP